MKLPQDKAHFIGNAESLWDIFYFKRFLNAEEHILDYIDQHTFVAMGQIHGVADVDAVFDFYLNDFFGSVMPDDMFEDDGTDWEIFTSPSLSMSSKTTLETTWETKDETSLHKK